MSDLDNSQDVTAHDQAAAENTAPVDNTAEQSLEDQLSLEPSSREEVEEAPEKPVEEAETTEETPDEKPDSEDSGEPESPIVPEGEDKTEPEDQPQETEAERNQRFYELRQEQKRLREEQVKQVNDAYSANYQPQPLEELNQHFIDQGYDENTAALLARDELRSQKEQISEARAQVAELNSQLTTEAVQVLHDFPVFDPASKEYDEAFAKRASRMYQKAAKPVIDPQTGLVVQTNETPYNFYKELADMRSSESNRSQIKAQKAVEQQMASVTPPSSSVPPSRSREDKQASDINAAFEAI